METYEEIVMQAVSQLMEKAISEQIVADEKLSALTDELADTGAEIKAFPLSEQQHTRLNRYLSITHTMEGMREENLYVQGAKDCFRLLKELGAFA